jgi:hypothetical protein
MNFSGDVASLGLMAVLAAAMVGVCVLVHYETLRFASLFMPRLTIRPRNRILFVMGAAFFAHSVEVWLCAALFYAIGHVGLVDGWAIGGIEGKFEGSFYEYLYFSTVSYTSLGLGDIYPTGVLRILTGVEALIGLVMIAWTGSFTYLAMEKFWSLHRTSAD